VLVGAAGTYASTQVFGHNQVGTEYADGIQVSGDQIIKPFGERLLTKFGKFMGSTISPDGRFVAATSADRSVVLQIFDLSSGKLIWTVGTASGVNQRLTNGTVGQEGPTYSPDGRSASISCSHARDTGRARVAPGPCPARRPARRRPSERQGPRRVRGPWRTAGGRRRPVSTPQGVTSEERRWAAERTP
jgi:hypothetical protein